MWQITGNVDSPNRSKSGRPRTATAPSVVAAVVAEMTKPKEGEMVPSSLSVKRRLKLPLCRRSIANAARAGGLQHRAKFRNPPMTDAIKRRRLRWARRLLRMRHNFRTTINSDEIFFVLEHQQRKCWTVPGQERVRRCYQHPASVMVWGGVSMAGSTSLAFIERTIKAPHHQEVLRKHLLPLVPTLPAGWTFQQDGARPNVAASTHTYVVGSPWHSPRDSMAGPLSGPGAN